jgi:hypothetical protein
VDVPQQGPAPERCERFAGNRVDAQRGPAAWLPVRSYLDSVRKYGHNALDAMHHTFTGNLWIPPIALPTRSANTTSCLNPGSLFLNA